MKTIINRDFTRLWYGQAVSKVGDYVFNTTLMLWIATKLGYHKSWAAGAVSGVLLSPSWSAGSPQRSTEARRGLTTLTTLS
ncbi:hypothetical protein KGQ20_12105 [Catenulispora sp. NF23]|uniref:Uncharacterized protein n=1 Tax=Catenulispora pinistramenti TaxID=2705254 RepID=A0ABS5KPG7_9ACTN|nr:hypothetical protein [Catenulispora pinistramenti]MBS2533516.1 hypothetical protein [Catenulispora pinistramenti]MBS2547884.1 hypothetical protein [Catenulispora pinistramenti]